PGWVGLLGQAPAGGGVTSAGPALYGLTKDAHAAYANPHITSYHSAVPPRSLSPRSQHTRAVFYARVPNDLREGRAVEEQEKETRAWVDREGWQLVDVLSDNDLSASRYARRTRPDWRRLIDMIRSGDVDVVVFWELSRGIRNRRDWAEFAE